MTNLLTGTMKHWTSYIPCTQHKHTIRPHADVSIHSMWQGQICKLTLHLIRTSQNARSTSFILWKKPVKHKSPESIHCQLPSCGTTNSKAQGVQSSVRHLSKVSNLASEESIQPVTTVPDPKLERCSLVSIGSKFDPAALHTTTAPAEASWGHPAIQITS